MKCNIKVVFFLALDFGETIQEKRKGKKMCQRLRILFDVTLLKVSLLFIISYTVKQNSEIN